MEFFASFGPLGLPEGRCAASTGNSSIYQHHQETTRKLSFEAVHKGATEYVTALSGLGTGPTWRIPSSVAVEYPTRHRPRLTTIKYAKTVVSSTANSDLNWPTTSSFQAFFFQAFFFFKLELAE